MPFNNGEEMNIVQGMNLRSEISHDGDSTEMRTMRRSSDSLQIREMTSVMPQNVVIEKTAVGSLSLNSSKLWHK